MIDKTNRIGIYFGLRCCALIAGVLVLFAGCQNLIPRGQSPDNSAMKFGGSLEDTNFVGAITAPWGLNFAKVEGVALVTQLDGTGSNPRQSGQREHLVGEMHSHAIEDVDDLLARDDNSLVVVRGYIPPAAEKGERFDLEVTTLKKSDTTSLEDGFLMQTRLRPMAVLGGRVQEGHVVARGRGYLMTDNMFNPSAGPRGKLEAIIPGGGVASTPRPVGLAIHRSQHSVKNSTAISTAINDRFTAYDGSVRIGVAKPKNDRMIEIRIAPEYKLNIGRYFRVLANIAYGESDGARLDRLQNTERELNDAATTAVAAIRLEAMGKDAIPSLNRGLRSDDAEVRFHSAQALVYMGETDGIEELAKAAVDEPAFRWHALTALASSNHEAAEDALVSMLNVSSAETRYGAFRALQQRSPDDPAYQGKFLNDGFYFAAVPSKGEPMVHVAKRHRPEIVLFGREQKVKENFLYVESGLTVKAKNANTVEIIRFVPGHGEARLTCSTYLDDLIHKMTKVGGSYTSIIAMLKDATLTESLDGDLVINALPKLGREYDRSRASAEYTGEESEQYVSGSLPNLFRTGNDESSSDGFADGSQTAGKRPASDFEVTAELPEQPKSWSLIPKIFR